MTKRRNAVAYTGRSPRMEDRDGVIHFDGSTPTRWPAAGLARRKRPAEIAENAEIPGTHRGMSGGKGAKGGNLDSLGNMGPAGDVVQRRKPAETGGNPFGRPHSGGKVFSGAGIGPPRRTVGDWRIACGNCGNPFDESTGVWRRPSETSETFKPVIG
jgi:hypothetical protein